MSFKEQHYRWEWKFKSKPEALWAWIADTNHFNHDAGLPVLENRLGKGNRLANAKRRLRLMVFGTPLEYEEEPFEWIRPRRFGVVRRYLSGPLDTFRQSADLIPEEGGTRLVYEVWVKPKNILGLISTPIQIGILSRRQFDTIFVATTNLPRCNACQSNFHRKWNLRRAGANDCKRDESVYWRKAQIAL